MYNVKQIIGGLEREAKWLKGVCQKDKHDAEKLRRRENLKTSCIAILCDSPQKDGYGLFFQRNDRKELIRDTKNWTSQKSVDAVLDMIELCKSDLLACEVAYPTRRCGCLEISAPTYNKEGLEKARKTRMDNKKKRDEELKKRIDERLGKDIIEE
jgi:hypothetical protein